MQDEIDWNLLAETLGPRLYNYFRRRGLLAQAADLTQETLIRLLEKVSGGEFDPTRGRIESFAFGIARFVGMEQQKKCVELVQPIENDQYPSNKDLEKDIQKMQQTRALRLAIKELSSTQQEVLWLILDEELSLDEISQILDTPIGTIKSHVHRAKEQLKIKLNPMWETV